MSRIDMCNCPSSLKFIILAIVITAIVTTLLSIAIFVQVQIVICKCCSPKKVKEGAEDEKVHESAYEKVEKNSCDPTYMEIGVVEKHEWRGFKLQENEAYA